MRSARGYRAGGRLRRRRQEGQSEFRYRPHHHAATGFRTGGDTVTKVAGKPIRDPDDLAAAIATVDPGSDVKVEIWRDGRRREVSVKLGERPLIAPDQPG